VEPGDGDLERAGNLDQFGGGIDSGVWAGVPRSIKVSSQHAVAAADIQQPGCVRQRFSQLDNPRLKLLPGSGEMLGKGLVKLMVKLKELCDGFGLHGLIIEDVRQQATGKRAQLPWLLVDK